MVEQEAVGRKYHSEEKWDKCDGELDQVFRAAAIGRICAGESVPWVYELIIQRLSTFSEHWEVVDAQKGTCLRELACLMQIGVYLIADDVDGETAMIHPSILMLSRQEESNVIQLLSEALIQTASACIEASEKIHAPRLANISVNALGCWCNTYLFPCGDEAPNLEKAFGGRFNGPRILDKVCQLGNQSLVSIPDDSALHIQVCKNLYFTLTKRKEIRAWLPNCPAWRELYTAFLSSEHKIRELGRKSHRFIAQALVQASESVVSPAEREEYLVHMVTVLAGEFLGFASSTISSPSDVGQVVIKKVCLVIEALRGTAIGMQLMPSAQQATNHVFRALLQPVLELQLSFLHEPSISHCLLKFCRDFIKGNIMLLEAPNAHNLCQWILEIFKIYTTREDGIAAVDISSIHDDECNWKKEKLFTYLICLLQHLCDNDTVENLDVSEAITLGLASLLPYISQERLQYPKGASQYFRLVQCILSNYPRKVVNLPGTTFLEFIRSLEDGVRHESNQVVLLALEALSVLALFNYKDTLNEGKGLTGYTCADCAHVPRHFLKVIFQLLLLGDQSQAIIEASSTALLCFMLNEQHAYRDMCHEVLPGGCSQGTQELVDIALQDLVQLNPGQDPLSKVNRAIFRSNLQKFVSKLRGVLKFC